MIQQLLITLGAGVASAVFFFLPAKGSFLALAIGIFAPLPLLIVALGYGRRSGVLAGLVGVALIAMVLQYLVALAYILSVAAPALILNHVARSEPDAPGYNVSRLLVWIVGLTVAIDWMSILVVGFSYPSYDAAIEDLAARFAPVLSAALERAGSVAGVSNALDLSAMLVVAMAPVMAMWGVFAFALNAWLAGRIVQISGLLAKPWQDIPATLALPRGAIVTLAVFCALALLPGAVRVFAATAAAAIGAALAMQGLAVLHQLTRGHPARVGMLVAQYGATLVVFPWPLFLAAGIGLFDLFRPLRPRGSRSPKPN